MAKELFGIWTLFVSIVVGVIAMTMFYSYDVGLSYPLFIGLLMVAVLGSGFYAQRVMVWRNLWLLMPALGFAVMVAFRADEWLTFWNVIASLTLSALALHYMGVKTPFDLTSTFDQMGALLATVVRATIFDPFFALFQSWKWFQYREKESETSQRLSAVVRGLLLTLPVLVVFGVLLGSADLIFADYLGKIGELFKIDNVDELFGRGFMIAVFAWVTAGVLTYGLARNYDPADDKETDQHSNPEDSEAIADNATTSASSVMDATEMPKRGVMPFPRLSMIEGGILLGGVNLLFGAFVLVQFVYLFGGRTNVSLDGFTFAEYARRGFFELVAVSVLAIGLLLIADRMIVREGKRENFLFRILALLVR